MTLPRTEQRVREERARGVVRPNPVKEKLQAGDSVFGTMLFEFNSPGMAAILEVLGL